MAPDPRSHELHGGEVVLWALVVACCDGSELFDAIEEPLHQVPLPIDPGRKGEGSPAVGLRRDVGPSLPLSDLTAGQPEADGPAFGVNECVDLAHKSATGTSHAAIVSSPFFPWPRVGERGHRWSRS